MNVILDPSKWKYHPKLVITFTRKVSLLDSNTKKKVKKLVTKVTGETFRYSKPEDPIWIAYKRGSKKKIYGICMLAKASPERHFNNESKGNVPYLYNMIVDISERVARSMKVSVSLLMKVKNALGENRCNDFADWLDSDSPNYINLNVDCSNKHAIEFYKKNGFVTEKKLYMQGNVMNIVEFKIMTFTF